MNLDDQLQIHLTKALPRWVETDNETFILFMEAYYEWLSQTGNVYETLHNMIKYRDIDETVDEFIEYFRQTYLYTIPIELMSDPRIVLKHIKDFYLAKGSEKAYKLLFRLVYNETVEFYYPNRDMLRVSDGKWKVDTSLWTTSNNDDYLDSRNLRIVGLTSGATAIIEEAIRFNKQDEEITEYYISQIDGTFEIDEDIEIINSDDDVISTETIHPVFNSVTITGGGEDYERGNEFYIYTPETNDPTEIAKGVVTAIQNGAASGPVTKVRFTVFGLAIDNEVVDFSQFGDGNAMGTANIGAIVTYPGRYINTDGHLSTDKVLQDSYYYQDFSYVLRSPVLFETYRDMVLKTIHPAGLLLFGETELPFNTEQEVSAAISEMTYAEFLRILINVLTNPVTFSEHTSTIFTVDERLTEYYEIIGDLEISRIWALYQDVLDDTDILDLTIEDLIPEKYNPPVPRLGQQGIWIADTELTLEIST